MKKTTIRTSTRVPVSQILEEDVQISLAELCHACAVHAERIIDLVEQGVLEPVGVDSVHWIFSGESLIRARTAIRLEDELQVNAAGVALALELMQEIENLRARLHQWPG